MSIVKTIVKKVKEMVKPMNDDGEMEVVDIALTVFIISAIVPAALIALNGANTSGFSTSQLALYGVIGLVALIAVVMGIIKFVKK